MSKSKISRGNHLITTNAHANRALQIVLRRGSVIEYHQGTRRDAHSLYGRGIHELTTGELGFAANAVEGLRDSATMQTDRAALHAINKVIDAVHKKIAVHAQMAVAASPHYKPDWAAQQLTR